MSSGKETCSLQLHGNYSKNLYNSISSKPVFFQEEVFNNATIRRIAVAMNLNSPVAGSFHENPFNYQQISLRELTIIRGEEELFH